MRNSSLFVVLFDFHFSDYLFRLCSYDVVVYAQAASAKVTVGSHVWVEDPDDAWIDGEVEEVNTEEITLNCSGKTVSAHLSSKRKNKTCYIIKSK